MFVETSKIEISTLKLKERKQSDQIQSSASTETGSP
jgi:hypothetical protein